MPEAITRRLASGWEWFRARAHGPHAKAWLFLVTFTEASFLLVAPEALLIPILLAGASRWVFYAALTTIASVLGGIAGYILGAFFFDTFGAGIIQFYNLADEIAHIGTLFEGNAFLVIFTAAFTPIPYKAFVLAGGFFKINIVSFVVASLLGRGLRFFAVAYLVRRFGAPVTQVVLRYSAVVTALVVVAALSWLVVRFGVL